MIYSLSIRENAIHNELIFKLDILINGARKRDNTSFFAEIGMKNIYTNAFRRIKFLSKDVSSNSCIYSTCWVIALRAEAAPIIKFLKLKNVNTQSNFTIYATMKNLATH